MLLVAVAAPLLAIAWPARRRACRPRLAFVGFAAVLWGWHWPAAYDLALSNLAVYWIMQLSLLGSARRVLARGLRSAARRAGRRSC